jgi:hypothetical protein
MKKGKHSIDGIRYLKKIINNLQKIGHEVYRGQETSLYSRSRDVMEATLDRRSTAY